jgi:hypothetical protein
VILHTSPGDPPQRTSASCTGPDRGGNSSNDLANRRSAVINNRPTGAQFRFASRPRDRPAPGPRLPSSILESPRVRVSHFYPGHEPAPFGESPSVPGALVLVLVDRDGNDPARVLDRDRDRRHVLADRGSSRYAQLVASNAETDPGPGRVGINPEPTPTALGPGAGV